MKGIHRFPEPGRLGWPQGRVRARASGPGLCVFLSPTPISAWLHSLTLQRGLLYVGRIDGCLQPPSMQEGNRELTLTPPGTIGKTLVKDFGSAEVKGPYLGSIPVCKGMWHFDWPAWVMCLTLNRVGNLGPSD